MIEIRKFPFCRLAALPVLASVSILVWSALVLSESGPRVADPSSNTVVTSIQHTSLPKKFLGQHTRELDDRLLYPYSVVPGGVHSQMELRNAIANDPVVAEHYFGFDLSKVRVFRLDKERSVYVSYRVGNRVFWTRNKMRLAKGETLVTDGAHLARMRCGNRLSERPQAPVSPSEPAIETLDTPLDLPLFAEEVPPELPSQLLPPNEINPIAPPGKPFIPPIFPVYWPGASSGPGPGSAILSSPPISTPEPGTLLLLSTSLSFAWVIRKKRMYSGSRPSGRRQRKKSLK